jgi:tRNA modification GTPase
MGGIGIIRISGPLALCILERMAVSPYSRFSGFKPWTMHRVFVKEPGGQILDDALAVHMPAPNTFTGEETAELHCHGGPAVLRAVLETVWTHGARPAMRGEFTRRAFLNGRMDLTQAEAVAEFVSASGLEASRLACARLRGSLGREIADMRAQLDKVRALLCVAVDFPEEEIESSLDQAALDALLGSLVARTDKLLQAFERASVWREEIVVALAGPVNSGKSSLMNALLGRDRALVSDIAGTTRDYLEEPVCMAGLTVRLVDTAGLRPTARPDSLEQQGMDLGREIVDKANAVMLLVDGKDPDAAITGDMLLRIGAERTVLVWNKSDLARPMSWWDVPPFTQAAERVVISSLNGDGLEELCQAVHRLILRKHEFEPDDAGLVPNARQAEALRRGKNELIALRDDAATGVPWDLCCVRLEGAAQALADALGLSTPDDVLSAIFDSFCIGK